MYQMHNLNHFEKHKLTLTHILSHQRVPADVPMSAHKSTNQCVDQMVRLTLMCVNLLKNNVRLAHH